LWLQQISTDKGHLIGFESQLKIKWRLPRLWLRSFAHFYYYSSLTGAANPKENLEPILILWGHSAPMRFLVVISKILHRASLKIVFRPSWRMRHTFNQLLQRPQMRASEIFVILLLFFRTYSSNSSKRSLLSLILYRGQLHWCSFYGGL
jgi:hypothetical protein